MANVFARRGKPFRLTPPAIPEHAIQKQICDVLRLELAPAGKVSAAGVVWFAIDHANYAGEVPGVRIGRGIVAGLPDLFFLYRGQAFLIELKTPEGALSAAQQSVAAAALSAGARYAVATSAEEVLACLDAWQIPRRRRLVGQGT
jgi:hypothetical protein